MYLKDCVTTFIQIQTQGMDTKLSETFKQPLKKLVTQQNTKVGTDGQTWRRLKQIKQIAIEVMENLLA